MQSVNRAAHAIRTDSTRGRARRGPPPRGPRPRASRHRALRPQAPQPRAPPRRGSPRALASGTTRRGGAPGGTKFTRIHYARRVRGQYPCNLVILSLGSVMTSLYTARKETKKNRRIIPSFVYSH